MSTGWRKGFADVVAAIQGTLADAANAGSMSAAEFLKLAGLPTSAVPTARLINTTAPLTGGGDLSADRTFAITAASGATAGSMSAADFTKLSAMGTIVMVSTPEIDLLTLNAQQNFDFSNLPAAIQASTAKTLFFAGSYFELTQLTGTASGSAALTVFNGGTAVSSTGAIAVSSAFVNGAFGLPQATLGGLPRTVLTPAQMVAGPLSAKVTTAIAGATVVKGKIVMPIYIDLAGTVLL